MNKEICRDDWTTFYVVKNADGFTVCSQCDGQPFDFKVFPDASEAIEHAAELEEMTND